MNTTINVIAWVVVLAAWLVILGAPVALVALLVVPRCRRWWLRPLRARRTARTERAQVMAQARRDARQAVLQAELDNVNRELDSIRRGS